jgi:hypothetical protein
MNEETKPEPIGRIERVALYRFANGAVVEEWWDAGDASMPPEYEWTKFVGVANAIANGIPFTKRFNLDAGNLHDAAHEWKTRAEGELKADGERLVRIAQGQAQQMRAAQQAVQAAANPNKYKPRRTRTI